MIINLNPKSLSLSIIPIGKLIKIILIKSSLKKIVKNKVKINISIKLDHTLLIVIWMIVKRVPEALLLESFIMILLISLADKFGLVG